MNVTEILIIINIILFVKLDKVSIFLNRYSHFSPYLFSNLYEYPRIIISNFCHASPIHLGLNMIGFYNIGTIVENIYKGQFIYIIFSFALLSNMIYILVAYLEKLIFNKANIYHTSQLGFSNIIFALRTLYYIDSRQVSNLFSSNAIRLIWYNVLITQIVFSKASFVGHVSGIISAFLFSYIINIM